MAICYNRIEHERLLITTDTPVNNEGHDMRLNERQQVIVTGVLRDRDYLAAQPCWPGCGLSRQALGVRRGQVRNAQAGVVPLDLHGWLGRSPTASEFVLFHREYVRLEGMGLIQRVNLVGGRRTTHLKLTAAGERAAAGLLAEDMGADRQRPEGRAGGRGPSTAADHDKVADQFEPIDLATIDWSTLELPPETPGGLVVQPPAEPAPAGPNTEEPTDPA
jgi:hypothetical protein